MIRSTVYPVHGIIKTGANQWAAISDISLSKKDQCVCPICTGELNYFATAPLKEDRLRYVCAWCEARFNVKVVEEITDVPNPAHSSFGLY